MVQTGVIWLDILLRELRDCIFEYALTQEGGLLADVDKEPNGFPSMPVLIHLRGATSDESNLEPNHLRLVC
jgi:hypothetical protein